MTYTLDDAIRHARPLEAPMAALGFHVAIGGSLVYRGTSEKDIDIFIYEHSREIPIDRVMLSIELEKLGYMSVLKKENKEWNESGEKGGPPHTCVPDVLPTTAANGDRVDFFFLSRPPSFYKEPHSQKEIEDILF